MFDKQFTRRGIALVSSVLLALMLVSCGGDEEDTAAKMMEEEKKPDMAMAERKAAEDKMVEEDSKMMDEQDAMAKQSATDSMSAGVLRTALRGVVNNPMVASWVRSDAFVSDFVRLVININQNQVSQSLSDFGAFKPRDFQPLMVDNRPYLGSSSFNRYKQLALMVDVLDAKSLVDLYDRSETLMQSEYASYGIPASRGNFKQQLKSAIDRVVAVNVSQNRIALTRDSVMYKYQSRSLEGGDDLNKLMYRIGPRNSRLIQSKLRQIRARL